MAIDQFSKPDQTQHPKHTDAGTELDTRRNGTLDISTIQIGNGIVEGLANRGDLKPFTTIAEFEAFWKKCDETAGPGREPDWEEHLQTIKKRKSSMPIHRAV